MLIEKFANFLKSKGRMKIIYDRQTHQPYMERYYIFFKNRPSWVPFNLVMHRILLSDPAGLHDHPWDWATMIIKGGYWETTPEGKFWRKAGRIRLRSAKAFHRLEIDKEKAGGDTWTIFLMGKQQREWGFINEAGIWIQWEEYLSLK